MGLLKVGRPLEWKDAVEHCRYIREHGITQFLNVWRKQKVLENDRLFYGDEVEYTVLKLDRQSRKATICCRSVELLEELRARERDSDKTYQGITWHQEYGNWMLEGTPETPYGGYTSSLLQVERNMRLRRSRLLAVLQPGEIAPTVVCFPLMGVGEFTSPAYALGGPASLSDSVPDDCINPHPRFATLTANIRSRRGGKVDIRVPTFQDAETKDSEIHMDCMAFGMGCCCLQVTFQCSDVCESRYLYDQLAVLAPIMLALTAATPVLHGKLADTDTRWHVIAASVDDRTPAERGEAAGVPDGRLVGGGVKPMSKSRYDSISTYLHTCAHSSPEVSEYYNDVPCEMDEDTFERLQAEHIDVPLAKHLAHLFARDPLVAFQGSVQEVNDEESTEHFESINSTNWQTVRWKPPPPRSQCAPHIGWRTEFRSMEVQMTDFENAAFTAFSVLVTRVLLVFDLDLLLPLSKVDDNMDRAKGVDAATTAKFWFRTHIIPDDVDQESDPRSPSYSCRTKSKTFTSSGFKEMSLKEIMSGSDAGFPGLIPLCYAYLDHIQCDPASFEKIQMYLNLIQRRANGELLTSASWIRNFVRSHPEYRKDSVVPQGTAYDLMVAINEIGLGLRQCPEVLGDVTVEPIRREADPTALGGSSSDEARKELLAKLAKRALACDGPGSMPSGSANRARVQSDASDIFMDKRAMSRTASPTSYPLASAYPSR